MTTQKVQSKIKSSTIAITVLSILLAVAVASTIVLAAFSANKTATVSLQFGGGLTLTVTGSGDATVQQGGANDKTVSITKTGISKVNTDTTNDTPLIGAVTATASADAYIAYAIAPSVSGEGFAIEAASTSEAGVITWAIKKSGSTVATLTLKYDSASIEVNTTGTLVLVTKEAGRTMTMFNGIYVTATNNVNDLANLEITGIATKIAAATVDSEGDYSTSAGVIADARRA